MIQRIVLVFISAFLCLVAISQETKIFGTIPGGDGYEVRLLSYVDLITYQTKVFDRVDIDDGGGFELTLNTNETIPVFLEVENYSMLMYVENGETYQLICDSIFPGNDYLPFYNKKSLQVNNISEPEPLLNSFLFYFDYLYEDFLGNNFETIYRSHKASIINGFVHQIDSLFEGNRNEFLQNYIRYKIASLKLSVSAFNKENVFDEFFYKQTVYYDNPEYMNFFHQYFNNYISGYNNAFVTRGDLYATINIQYNYPALLDSLGKDTILRNEVIREMVLLKTLKELFYDPDYSKQNIIHMLDQLKENSKFERHQTIAANIIHQLTRFEKSFPAPPFTLSSLDGDSLSLDYYQGKPVYLSFMTTWSYACLSEFELLSQLYDKYGNSIHFVTISLDKNPEVVSRFRNDKGYYWDFLYNGSSYDLLMDYDIKTFPMFVLIDKKGKIFQFEAYKPSELIEESFKQVLKK